jgi:hypothetical protein
VRERTIIESDLWAIYLNTLHARVEGKRELANLSNAWAEYDRLQIAVGEGAPTNYHE